MSNDNSNKPCPNCGYCQHCGRGGHYVSPWPYSPWQPYYTGPWWGIVPPSQPFWQTGTVGMSEASFTNARPDVGTKTVPAITGNGFTFTGGN